MTTLSNQDKIGQIQALLIQPGWSLIKEWLSNEIKALDSKINTVDPTQNQVVYTQKDVHILDKQNMISLMEKPERMIRELQSYNEGPTLNEALKDINVMKPIPTAPQPILL